MENNILSKDRTSQISAIPHALLAQLGASRILAAWLYIPAIIGLALVVFVSIKSGIPLADFFRDPASTMESSPFLGFVSQIGVLMWCASAVTCFFSYSLIRKTEGSRDVSWFLLLGGLITSVLLFDDFFMLHDEIFQDYFNFGEKKTFLIYGMIVLAYLVKFRKLILGTSYIFLVLACSCFALSIIVDRLPQTLLPLHHLFEDGFKFIGIVSWFGYYFTTCTRAIHSSLHSGQG